MKDVDIAKNILLDRSCKTCYHHQSVWCYYNEGHDLIPEEKLAENGQQIHCYIQDNCMDIKLANNIKSQEYI